MLQEGSPKISPKTKKLHGPPTFPSSCSGELCWDSELSLQAHGTEMHQGLLDFHLSPNPSIPLLEQAHSFLLPQLKIAQHLTT